MIAPIIFGGAIGAMAITFTAAGIVADAIHRASRRQVEAIERPRADLAAAPKCGLALGEAEIQLAELVAENFPKVRVGGADLGRDPSSSAGRGGMAMIAWPRPLVARLLIAASEGLARLVRRIVPVGEP